MGYNQEAFGAECTPSPEHWRLLREDKRHRNRSRSPPMHKQPSEEWLRMSLALARCMPSRPENISQHYGWLGLISPLGSGGVRHTKGPQETRMLTSGPSSQWESQMPTGWNGWVIQAGWKYVQCHFPGPSHTSSERSLKRSGWRHGNGLEAGPSRRSTECRKARGQMVRSLGVPRGSPLEVYQLKTWRCLTRQHLQWAENRPTAQCWWCRCPTQTRDHLFKVSPGWKAQQKVLGAKVRKESRRWKSRWKIRDLLANGRCGRAVLDFLSSMVVGRLVLSRMRLTQGVKCQSGSRERWEREEGRRAEELPLFLPTPSFMTSADEE